MEMEIVLAVLILLAAMLYSAVGHGGASGYLAAMALVGVAPATMKPTALALNVIVASIALVKYYRAGCFSWPLFWPLAVASVPFAFLGGWLTLPGHLYKPLVGLALLYAAWRLWRGGLHADSRQVTPPPLAFTVAGGAGIGFFSGLTGVGGGIFLSPVLILNAWAGVRQVSGVAAAFILVNSAAALAGLAQHGWQAPAALPLWAATAAVGGIVGAEYGSRRLGKPAILRLLAVVLVIAGMKMIFT